MMEVIIIKVKGLRGNNRVGTCIRRVGICLFSSEISDETWHLPNQLFIAQTNRILLGSNSECHSRVQTHSDPCYPRNHGLFCWAQTHSDPYYPRNHSLFCWIQTHSDPCYPQNHSLLN